MGKEIEEKPNNEENKSVGIRENKAEKKTTRLNLADLLIPIVSAFVFIMVLFFILIPSINNSNEVLSEIEEVESDQEILRRNLETVEAIDFTQMQRDLSNARKVLPRRLEVAQFAYYVDSLAEEKDLEFRELRAGDVSISEAEEDISTLNVKGIRVPMEYTGNYEPILDFFNELQTVSPYVISFGYNVELNKLGEDDDTEWGLEIDITGHHVREDEELARTTNLYLPITPYNSDEELVQEFTERVEILID